mmetsp:Transcript_22511/g.46776  ORF Transcript_22511/g.46776 Transcript_22511/m.46776 type:complete len:215 (+) Transcript_22511:110-754(+)
MGRRGKLLDDDEEDDGLERLWASRNSGMNKKRAREEAENATVDPEKAERKRLKKLRQKEKKAERKRVEEEEKEKEKKRVEAERADMERKKNKKKKKKKKKEEGGEKDVEWNEMNYGIKWRDLQVGTGPIVEDRTRIRVSYVGRQNDSQGKVFDRSSDFSFKIGKGDVIKGWDFGLRGARKGTTRVLSVPPKAGYGNRNLGWGSNAHLWFKVTIL